MLGTLGKLILWTLALVGGVVVVRRYGPRVMRRLTGKAMPGQLGSGVTLVPCGTGVTSTGSASVEPKDGLQSSPFFSWCYLVRQGDTAGRIAERVTGDSARYTELLVANPGLAKKGTMGVVTGPDAWDFAGGLTNGSKLIAPQVWNAWIDQKGRAKGGYMPWEPDTRILIEAKGEPAGDTVYDHDVQVDPTYSRELAEHASEANGEVDDGFDYAGAVS